MNKGFVALSIMVVFALFAAFVALSGPLFTRG